MLLLAAILGVFFAFLTAEEGARLRRGLLVGGGLFGGALLVGIVMFLFS
jgi:hypothetical protein